MSFALRGETRRDEARKGGRARLTMKERRKQEKRMRRGRKKRKKREKKKTTTTKEEGELRVSAPHRQSGPHTSSSGSQLEDIRIAARKDCSPKGSSDL